MQLLCAVVYIALYLSAGDRSTLIMGVGFLAIFLWAQMQIISAAIPGKNRIPIALFWTIFVCILAATIVVVRLFG